MPDEDARRAGCDGLAKTVDAARIRMRETAFASPGIFTFGWIQDNGGAGAMAAAAYRADIARDGLRIAAAARDYMLGRNPGRKLRRGAGRDRSRASAARISEGNPRPTARRRDRRQTTTRASLLKFDLTLADVRFRQFDSPAIVYEDRRENFQTSEVGLSYSASALLLASSLDDSNRSRLRTAARREAWHVAP